jgi:hypothetical protein
VAGQWRWSAAVSTSGTAAWAADAAARGALAALAALTADCSRGRLAAGRGELLAAGAAFAPAADSRAGRAVGLVVPWFPASTAATIPVTATRTATAAVVLSRVRDRGIGAFMCLPVPLVVTTFDPVSDLEAHASYLLSAHRNIST